MALRRNFHKALEVMVDLGAGEALDYCLEEARLLLHDVRWRQVCQEIANPQNWYYVLLRPDGTIIEVGERTAATLGFRPESLRGVHLHTVLPGEKGRRRVQFLAEVVRTGRVTQYAGQGGRCLMTVYPILNTQGQVTHVAVVGRSVPERVFVETPQRGTVRILE